jgi:multicomponent Na+:H+ antiporter subunit C
MEWLAAITTGTLAGLGLWMLLDRNLKRVVLGIAVLGNAINLGVFTASRFIGERAAFVDATNNAATANPLPQALVLTAIVIGFSLFIFALALLKRTRELHGDKTTDSVSSITEQPAPDWHAGEHEADGTGVEARR